MSITQQPCSCWWNTRAQILSARAGQGTVTGLQVPSYTNQAQSITQGEQPWALQSFVRIRRMPNPALSRPCSSMNLSLHLCCPLELGMPGPQEGVVQLGQLAIQAQVTLAKLLPHGHQLHLMGNRTIWEENRQATGLAFVIPNPALPTHSTSAKTWGSPLLLSPHFSVTYNSAPPKEKTFSMKLEASCNSKI